MACGDKYKDMIRTATGRTPEEPCALHENLCFPGEYDPWHIAAAAIARGVKLRWDALAQQEQKAETDEYSDALRNRFSGYVEQFDKLPSNTWGALLTPEVNLISEAITNMREGTCVMDLLDQAIEAAGGKAPPSPQVHLEGTLWDDLAQATILVVVVGALGALAFYGVRKSRGKQQIEEAA